MSLAHPLSTELRLLAADAQQGGDGSGSTNGGPQRPRGGGAGAAYVMAASVLLGVGLGVLIDRHFGTSPWWTLALSMFFLAVGVYHVIRETQR